MTTFAFVFPGQGSQTVGMLDAWGDHPAVRDTLAEASQALGEDIGRLIHEGPKEQLDLTTNTQPVMLAAAVACYRAWLAETGRVPSLVAGHSLGEYSALVAAGSLKLADALPLVRFRAQAMQEAVPVGAGAMAAILGLDADVVRSTCAEVEKAVGETVSAANYNDPKQTVIAGTKAAVDQACEALKGRGAKRALPLAVSAPFHCALMKPAADRLKERLVAVALRAPQIPLVNNIDVAVQSDPDAVREALYRQAFGPVRWVEIVQALRARGATHLFECGPATGWQLSTVGEGRLDFLIDALSQQKRLIGSMENHLGLFVGPTGQVFLGSSLAFRTVGDNLSYFVGISITDDTEEQILVAIYKSRSNRSLGFRNNGLPAIPELFEIFEEFLVALSFGFGSDDETDAGRLHEIDHGLEAGSFSSFRNTARNTDAALFRHKHQKATGQTYGCRYPGTFVSGGLFSDLHKQFLLGHKPFFERSLSGHVVGVQEAHLVFAQINEGSIDTGQNVFHRSSIDVTEQEFASVDEKLHYSIVFQQGGNIVLLRNYN